MIEQIFNFYESLTICKWTKINQNQIQINFTAQLIFEIKLIHYLSQLSACPDMLDYTHVKWLRKFVAFIDV